MPRRTALRDICSEMAMKLAIWALGPILVIAALRCLAVALRLQGKHEDDQDEVKDERKERRRRPRYQEQAGNRR